MATETANPSASTSTPIVDDNHSDQASHTDPVPPPVHEHSTKPSSPSWFTFDDIPRHKWAARLQEFAAWIDLQGTKPNAQPHSHFPTIGLPPNKCLVYYPWLDMVLIFHSSTYAGSSSGTSSTSSV